MENWKENNVWHGLSMNTIYNMDCIEGMKMIPDWSIDCIITDPPYWTTACKWDTVIPFDKMWEQLKRIIKPNWAIVLFWSEPFSSALRMSNIKNYKYDWIWEKTMPTWVATSSFMPMKYHENISVFVNNWKPTFNKQLMERSESWKIRAKTPIYWNSNKSNHIKMADIWAIQYNKDKVNPKTIIKVNSVANSNWKLHPTQKPVALIEYLIKTYTNEWETVLDFTAGSWTTGVACKNTNRKYILIEKDEKYFQIMKERILTRTPQ